MLNRKVSSTIVGIHVLLITLFVIGIYGALNLVLEEIKTGNGCPKIGFIPACLIILFCFLISFISHVLKKWNLVYFIGTGIAFAIALYATTMQIIGKVECPKLDNGLPMCYISLFLFLSLILLKIVLLKNALKNECQQKYGYQVNCIGLPKRE